MILATAPSLEALLVSIEKFYCGTEMEIIEEKQVKRLSDGKVLEGVEVVKKGKRWQFRGKEGGVT